MTKDFEPKDLVNNVMPLMNKTLKGLSRNSKLCLEMVKYEAIVWVMQEDSLDEDEKLAIINNVIRQ